MYLNFERQYLLFIFLYNLGFGVLNDFAQEILEGVFSLED
jgi:hypothetical protein